MRGWAREEARIRETPSIMVSEMTHATYWSGLLCIIDSTKSKCAVDSSGLADLLIPILRNFNRDYNRWPKSNKDSMRLAHGNLVLSRVSGIVHSQS